MIADLDETLREILIAELPVQNGEIDIQFKQPRREWSAKLIKPTLNLYLFEVRENATLRRHQWEKMQNGNGRSNGPQAIAEMKRSPFRVDCHYMITAWATEEEDEHRLLTRTLLSLFRHPVLPTDKFQGQMTQQSFPVHTRLIQEEDILNPAELWGALDNELRPTISYIVTLALDPWTEVSSPIVKTRSLRVGQAEGLPHAWQLAEDGTDQDLITFGGYIHSKNEPQAGVEVAIKGTGLFATTDEDGRYRLGSVPPGEYTLVAWQAEGKPKEHKVTIPAEAEHYDFEI